MATQKFTLGHSPNFNFRKIASEATDANEYDHLALQVRARQNHNALLARRVPRTVFSVFGRFNFAFRSFRPLDRSLDTPHILAPILLNPWCKTVTVEMIAAFGDASGGNLTVYVGLDTPETRGELDASITVSSTTLTKLSTTVTVPRNSNGGNVIDGARFWLYCSTPSFGGAQETNFAITDVGDDFITVASLDVTNTSAGDLLYFPSSDIDPRLIRGMITYPSSETRIVVTEPFSELPVPGTTVGNSEATQSLLIRTLSVHEEPFSTSEEFF